MTDHYPTAPLDPLAEQVALFFAHDPGWLALTETPPALVRAGMRAAAAPTRLPALPRVEDHEIAVAGGTIPLRLYAPVASAPAVLVWAHGGGWTLGCTDEIDGFCRALAAATGCAVVSVDYRLAPEHPFPTAVEDLEAAVLWVADNLGEIASPGAPVFVGGDSAGGNLATVVTRRIHAAGSARITGNVLAYPMVEAPDAESLRRFEPPCLGLREVTYFSGLYAPDPAAHRHPDFVPSLAGDLGVLPPTLIITAGYDILTEQGETYARTLAAQGVEAELWQHPGMIHGYLTLDAFLPGPGAETIAGIAAFVTRHR